MTYVTTRQDETNFCAIFDGPLRVLIDGEEVKFCVEADDEKGFVVLIDCDAAGEPRIAGDELVTVQRFGKVELIGHRRT